MKIFNTLTRTKEEFVPINEGKVGIYVCGPTVYDYIHIGNARPMIVFDTLRRYLTYKGYDVNYVSNFTDVDDKIIKRANEEGVDSKVISERFIAETKKDMAAMNVQEATTHPKATEEIPDMIEMIKTLIEKGHAYEVNGTVYFRTRSFADYGKLSHKNIDDLESWNTEQRIISLRFPVRMRRKIRWISFFGSQRKRENRSGSHHGVKEDRAGIWNVLLCLRNISVISLISMQVVRI